MRARAIAKSAIAISAGAASIVGCAPGVTSSSQPAVIRVHENERVPNVTPPQRLDIILAVPSPSDYELASAFMRCTAMGGKFVSEPPAYLCQGVDY